MTPINPLTPRERIMLLGLVFANLLGAYLILNPSPVGIAAAFGALLGVVMAIYTPQSSNERILFICAAFFLFFAESRAIHKSNTENLRQMTEIKSTAQETLENLTGGDSIPVVVVAAVEGDWVQLALKIHGKFGLGIKTLYMTNIVNGERRFVASDTPGYCSPNEQQILNLTCTDDDCKDRTNAKYGQFLLRDPLKLHFAFTATNGTYEEYLHVKRKKNNWKITWHVEKTQDPKVFLDGEYPVVQR